MRVLIAPDKFKGSLSAIEAAEAIRAGILRVVPEAEFDLCPIADGGEGTAAAIHSTLGGEWIAVDTVNARGEPLRAEYLWLPEQRRAILDMSAASGLAQLPKAAHDPLEASTFGTGLLVADARKRGAKSIWIGLGGSATNDAGCGLAQALGWRFLDSDEKEVFPTPATLQAVSQIVPPSNPIDCEIVALSDVDNPLLGPRGCSAVFGPQKGASPKIVAELESALTRIANLVEATTGRDWRDYPGAGAAGGLGFGILAFAAGKLKSGFDTIAELLDLDLRIQPADWVLTAEGKLDAQTLHGKGPAGVAELARRHGKPIFAFAGKIEDEAELLSLFDAVFPIADSAISVEESMRNARLLLTTAAERAARQIPA